MHVPFGVYERQSPLFDRGREPQETDQDGVSFYQEHGLSQSPPTPTDLDGEEHEELVLERQLGDGKVLEFIEGPDGEQLYVDYTGGETGTLAPLYPTFLDEALGERYGRFCSNCNATVITMRIRPF